MWGGGGGLGVCRFGGCKTLRKVIQGCLSEKKGIMRARGEISSEWEREELSGCCLRTLKINMSYSDFVAC